MSKKTTCVTMSKNATIPPANPKAIPTVDRALKKSTNKEQADGSTKEEKEYLWGYGSGVASATIAEYGDVVLADYTQTFNENDLTYFISLSIRTVGATFAPSRSISPPMPPSMPGT